jgi:hypothetical protein
VYGELKQRVVSKKRKNAEGTDVQAEIWRDVVIDGQVAIPKGTLMTMRIENVKSAKPAGIPGKLALKDGRLVLDDGRSIALVDGYSMKGANATGSAIVLALFIAWPLIFMTGQNVKLENGTIFDATIDETFEVARDSNRSPEAEDSPVDVMIRKDEMNSKRRLKSIPMEVTVCEEEFPSSLVIDRVNDVTLKKPVQLKIKERSEDNGCHTAVVSARRKVLKRFKRGINWFDVAYGGPDNRVATEVIVDKEL